LGVIAFEVSVNGEHQYTVGAESWQHITTYVVGHHIDPNQMRKMAGEDIPDLPTSPFDYLQLHATVSISGEDFQFTDPSGHMYTRSKSGSYPNIELSPGDEIRIRVIESDAPDAPEWQVPEPRFPGPTVNLLKPDSE
jgi:hypothetical protein